ncbi:MAG: hypothetical protein IPL98_05275 [Saprospiraceae bacterium]|nr:hypothetical protein [Saprospiraceae bacterium]
MEKVPSRSPPAIVLVVISSPALVSPVFEITFEDMKMPAPAIYVPAGPVSPLSPYLLYLLCPL